MQGYTWHSIPQALLLESVKGLVHGVVGRAGLKWLSVSLWHSNLTWCVELKCLCRLPPKTPQSGINKFKRKKA